MAEAAPPENLAVRLRLRGTFIDVDDSVSVGSPRRALSEPRQPVQKRMEFAEQDAYVQKLSSTCMAARCPNFMGSSSSERCLTPRSRNAAAGGGCVRVAERGDFCGSKLGEAHYWHRRQDATEAGNSEDASDNDSHEAVASDDSHGGHGRRWRDDEVGAVDGVVLGWRTVLTMPIRRRRWGSIDGMPIGGVIAPSYGIAVGSSSSSACTPTSSREDAPDALNPLAAAVGRWRVADGPMVGSIWTIEEDGRALFNGKRFSTKYDVQLDPGPPISLRADCWSVNLDLSSNKKLVWSRADDPFNVTWHRLADPAVRRECHRDRGKTGRKEAKLEEKMQLQSKMQASAQRMSAGWGSEGRLSSAMAAIEEIPFRISEDMQRAASYYIDSMQSEVAAMSKHLRNGGTWRGGCGMNGELHEVASPELRVDTEQVIKNLEVIPTMVHNLLEARVEKARSKVRRRVRGVIQNLSAIKEERWEDADNEVLVSKMRMISEEVEQIAGDAVRAAAQECHAHAVKQLDCALTALREGEPTVDAADPCARPRWSDMIGETGGGGGCNGWCVTHDPEFWSKTVMGTSAKHSMEQFAAVVQDRASIPRSFTNQVVADELLRARIRSGGGNNGGGATATLSGVQSSHGGGTTATLAGGIVSACNPGSRGHPDLCIRPCLYFAQGSCTNGNECAFCHLPHPKRPVRFDKLHRESLKRMCFGQFLSIMLPVLKQKVRGLDIAAEAAECLEALWAPLHSSLAAEGAMFDETEQLLAVDGLGQSVSSNASASGSERSIRRGSIAGALHVMGFRSLLSMLQAKIPDDRPHVRAQLEQVVRLLHDSVGAPPHTERANVTTVNSEEFAAFQAQSQELPRVWESPPVAGGDCVQRRVYQPPPRRQASFQNGRARQRHWNESTPPGPHAFGAAHGWSATMPVGR